MSFEAIPDLRNCPLHMNAMILVQALEGEILSPSVTMSPHGLPWLTHSWLRAPLEEEPEM